MVLFDIVEGVIHLDEQLKNANEELSWSVSGESASEAGNLESQKLISDLE